jgi:hypothetical protein
VQLARREQLS